MFLKRPQNNLLPAQLASQPACYPIGPTQAPLQPPYILLYQPVYYLTLVHILQGRRNENFYRQAHHHGFSFFDYVQQLKNTKACKQNLLGCQIMVSPGACQASLFRRPCTTLQYIPWTPCFFYPTLQSLLLQSNYTTLQNKSNTCRIHKLLNLFCALLQILQLFYYRFFRLRPALAGQPLQITFFVSFFVSQQLLLAHARFLAMFFPSNFSMKLFTSSRKKKLHTTLQLERFC